MYEQRSEAIRALRMKERKELRRLELSLSKKQKDKELMREQLATIANRDVLIKKEKQKLKEQEIENYRNEKDVDRKIQQNKILKRH